MIRLYSRGLAAALCFVATPALAESPFDGTWKGQLGSMKIEAKPDVFAIKDGIYSCSTCIPAVAVKADGAFHAASGHAYWDDLSVTVVDDHKVSYSYRKAGKVVATSTDTVSADGGTLMSTSHNTNNAAGVPIDATSSETRVGTAPAGAHLISGSWQPAPANAVSDAALLITLRDDGETLHLSSPMGETLAAKFGGPFAPNVGDPGKTMTKAERIGPRSIRLTDMRLGKVTSITTYTIAADGTTMTGTFMNPRDGSKGSFTAIKQ